MRHVITTAIWQPPRESDARSVKNQQLRPIELMHVRTECEQASDVGPAEVSGISGDCGRQLTQVARQRAVRREDLVHICKSIRFRD